MSVVLQSNTFTILKIPAQSEAAALRAHKLPPLIKKMQKSTYGNIECPFGVL